VISFALPAAYFRFALPAHANESRIARAIGAVPVGVVAFLNIRMVSDGHTETYFLLAAVLAGSYALAWQLSEGFATAVLWASAVAGVVALAVVHGFVIHGVKLLTGFGTARCLMFLNSRRHRPFVQFQKAHTKWIGVVAISFVGMFLVPPLAIRVAKFLLPVNELQDAYNLVGQFVGQEKLEALVLKLMVVTALCQVSLGYLGIAFLRQGQNRKNYLLVIGNGEGTGKSFSKLVLRYMLFAALPYMLQRTIVENVNFYVYGRFAREVERSIRLNSVFPLKEGRATNTLLAAVHGSKYTIDAYTDAFNSIVDVSYRVVESKLFALPKLLLFPGMLQQQPMLVVSILPASIILDEGRSRMFASLTKRIEKMVREIRELSERRRKIEQHDAKHEELIRRGAASDFALSHWREVATVMEGKTLRYYALSSFRAFINGLYKQDFFTPGIELVLAFLLETKFISSTDIWVYMRVIEETIDFLLTRSRMDATLASMKLMQTSLALQGP